MKETPTHLSDRTDGPLLTKPCQPTELTYWREGAEGKPPLAVLLPKLRCVDGVVSLKKKKTPSFSYHIINSPLSTMASRILFSHCLPVQMVEELSSEAFHRTSRNHLQVPTLNTPCRRGRDGDFEEIATGDTGLSRQTVALFCPDVGSLERLP